VAHATLSWTRVVASAAILLGALFASAECAPVEVRYHEGVTRGYLVINGPDKRPIGSGDLSQVLKGDAVESRMVLDFTDGSRYDETVVFSQRSVFTVLRYHLVQRGSSFPEEQDVSFDRAKRTYSARTGRGDSRKEASGTLDLPADVYNGMAVILLRNLGRERAATVSVLAFTPKPLLTELEMRPVEDESRAVAGSRPVRTSRFVLVPKLGAIRRAGAMLLGKSPSNSHCWITGDGIPAFVRMDAALYPGGPIWSIEPVSPHLAPSRDGE
jgi:hypothetical protein